MYDAAPQFDPPLPSDPLSDEKERYPELEDIKTEKEEPKDIYHKTFSREAIREIGTNKHFTPGRETTWRKKGLWGAFRNFKAKGRSTGENLSWEDLRKLHPIIEKQLKRRPAYPHQGRALSKGGRGKAIGEARALVKTGEISREDFYDFKKILNVLHEKNPSEHNRKLIQKLVMKVNSPKGNFSQTPLSSKTLSTASPQTDIKSRKPHLQAIPSLKDPNEELGENLGIKPGQQLSSPDELKRCEEAIEAAKKL